MKVDRLLNKETKLVFPNVINKRMVSRKRQNTECKNKNKSENLTIILINKKQKVQIIVLVNIKMSGKVRRKCS